jgi:plastocyanin
MKIKNVSSKLILKLFAVMILALNVSSGCSKSNSGNITPGANEVFIQSYAFSPSTITISVNSSVTWTNKDGTAHTVTSDNSIFDSGLLEPNTSYTRHFTTVGTFNYHCTVHSTMKAKVIVQ